VRVEIGAPRGAVVGIGQPLPLQLAPEVAAQPDQTIFRFWVGRALARALQGGAVVQQLDDRELTELFDALYARKPQSSSAQQLKKQLSKLLSRKLRKHLETHQPADLGPRLWAGYRLAINQRADRLGLVLSRHPGVALCELAALDGVAAEDISQAPKLAPLLRFVVSEDYVRLYRAVWR